jgi:hypothetical protein
VDSLPLVAWLIGRLGGSELWTALTIQGIKAVLDLGRKRAWERSVLRKPKWQPGKGFDRLWGISGGFPDKVPIGWVFKDAEKPMSETSNPQTQPGAILASSFRQY